MTHGIHRPNSCCVLCYHRARRDSGGHMPLTTKPDTTAILKGGTQRLHALRGVSLRAEMGAFDKTW